MSTAGCVEPASSSHHSTYATFRSIKSASSVISDAVKQQYGNLDYPNVATNPNSRGSSVVSAIMRSSSFISAEEEAHRMLRTSQMVAQQGPEMSIARSSAVIISSPAEHNQRLVPAAAPTAPVPASFSEHLLSLDHADSLLMTSSIDGCYEQTANANQQLVHSSLPPLPPQSIGAESQRSLTSNSSSTGYHSSSSVSGTANRSAVRSLFSSDDISPPPSSASSASSSSGVVARQSANSESNNLSINPDFFVKSSSLSNANSSNGSTVASSAYVPRCSSAHTALAAIDEELPPLQPNEIAQVDIFYRSLKTEVRVASSMAQMFIEEASGSNNSSSMGSVEDHDQVACGVPLFLVDKFPNLSASNNKSRRTSQSASSRQALYLILAERGTGFTLRRERITQRDCYTLASSSADTHRLTVVDSKGLKSVYLIKFANSAAAGQFFSAYNELTRGDAIFASPNKKSGSNSNSNGFSSWWKGKLPSKLSLSRPCCFRHLTTLDSSYMALSQTAVIASPEHRRLSQPALSQVMDQRSQTMPRRASATPTGGHSSSVPASAPSPAIRPSALSPLASSLPCRVSMTPLAACTPVAPSLG